MKKSVVHTESEFRKEKKLMAKWLESTEVSELAKNKKSARYKIEQCADTERAWKRFRKALAAALSGLEEDEFLIISTKPSRYFVQFAGQGTSGLRVEARSNTFIEKKKDKLSRKACLSLVNLGWDAPTYVPTKGEPEPSEGSSNYFVDNNTPVSFKNVASLSVDTLQQIYKVHHPSELTYSAFSDGGIPIRFPLLGIDREN